MLSIVRKFTFEAAHHLPNHPGACKHLHGHSYKLEIGVTGPVNPDTGMIADFKNLKDKVNETIIEYLDHSYLNDLEYIHQFPAKNPTAENLLLWIVEKLNMALKPTGCNVSSAKLWETENAWVEWVLR